MIRAKTVVSDAKWNPYGPLAGFSSGNGLATSFTLDSDYRITRVRVGSAAAPGSVLDRSLSWTGDMIDRIADNQFPGTTPPFTYTAQTQSFLYTPTHRLRGATGYYGALSWTYDGVGNRLSETANGAASSYSYPPGSNRLASVATGAATRSFTYDAAGNVLTDSRGGVAMSFQYDVEGRLSKAWQTGAPVNGGTYGYDAMGRLVSRIVTKTTAPTSVTTLYVHDINDHIIAETNTAGVTLREYIWLNDLPIAVVDNVNTTSPTLYYVHTDHLGRPARMTAQNWAWAWDVIYSPFGAVSAIFDTTAKLDLRFPGQWFQLESGLAYNWHRHYDASLGRYVQPDPIGFEGGRSLYGYVGQNPLAYLDPDGLAIRWPKVGIDWDAFQKQMDNDNYHRICDRKEPPGLSPCASARWRYRQAKVCYQRRLEWEERWGDETTGAKHEGALQQVKDRMRNASDDIKRYCNSQVCPPDAPED